MSKWGLEFAEILDGFSLEGEVGRSKHLSAGSASSRPTGPFLLNSVSFILVPVPRCGQLDRLESKINILG